MLMRLTLRVPVSICTLLWPSFSHPFRGMSFKSMNPYCRWGAPTAFATYNIKNTEDSSII